MYDLTFVFNLFWKEHLRSMEMLYILDVNVRKY